MLNKEILRLAIPNILSNLSVPLLSTVDTALMGRQESAIYIGAVALGSLLFNFIYWSFSFLRMGTTGLTAQAFGKQDRSLSGNILGRAIITAAIGSLILLILQQPIALLSFRLLQASPEVESVALEYFYIRIWAAPATLGLYVFMGWYFGMQNVLYPLILTVFINIINIVSNLYLVNGLGMTADGVALGTVIAQYCGLSLAVLMFYFKYRDILPHIQRKVIFEWQAFKSFLSLNRDIFIRTFCLIFAFAFFDNESAKQGDIILAVNAVLLQFVSWMSYGIDGIAYATESLVGRYVGASRPAKYQRAIRYAFYWGMAFAVFYSVLYLLFGNALLNIFSDQPQILEPSLTYLIWVILFPLLATPSYIWDGIFIGHTASLAMRNTMILAMVCYLLFYYIQVTYFDLGNHGLWLSLLVFMMSRGYFQWIWYRNQWLISN